jgi:hypothetical protein
MLVPHVTLQRMRKLERFTALTLEGNSLRMEKLVVEFCLLSVNENEVAASQDFSGFRVSLMVLVEDCFGGEASIADRALEGFFLCVASDVDCHVLLADESLATERTNLWKKS